MSHTHITLQVTVKCQADDTSISNSHYENLDRILTLTIEKILNNPA